jgi:hypothetical protein
MLPIDLFLSISQEPNSHGAYYLLKWGINRKALVDFFTHENPNLDGLSKKKDQNASKRFIVDNVYNNNLSINGELTLIYPDNNSQLHPSIKLIKGNAIDNNIDYKIWSSNNDFKITSSLSSIDIDRFVISSNGDIKINGNMHATSYLSGDINPDYLRCLTLHGFKTIFGFNCHDYPKVPHIYKSNNINYKNLYGKGFTYTNLLEPTLHDDKLDYTIIEDINNKYYDIIIYGSYHRGMPYYDLICKIYKPNEIILLCGEDIHCCNYNDFLLKKHNVFVREL